VPGGTNAVTRSSVSTGVAIPNPPFWGHRVISDVPLDEMFTHLDLKTLFRLHWGARSLDGEEWDKLLRDEFLPRLERMKSDARSRGFLRPQVIYGYFPCNGDGNELVIYDPLAPDPVTTEREIARFRFPRQQAWDRLCLADYFAPLNSGRRDVVAIQVVTVGDEVDRLVDDLQAGGDYSESYFVHGLSVQSAEATAEWAHQRVRRELGIGEAQGKRYSWGYPACPDLADHEVVFRLLPAREKIGVDLTTAFQLVPEQSTAAMVVHHPDAKYYSTLAPVTGTVPPSEAIG
jgi:5-methyltetrahydrofolate--homocysteine methyltransferase